MIGYFTLGTNDIQKGARFYDALLGEIGIERVMDGENFIAWGKPGVTAIALTRPFDGQAASVGNGTMMALEVESRELVDILHAKAMDLDAPDEGLPGPRGQGVFYGAYFRDPDGHKICVFNWPR